jgi:putative ABC transport system permease protein
MMNVRERRYEIGIMRALGYGSAKITLLFLGKALIVGVAGAVLGFGIGTILASRYGPDIFKVTAKMIKPEYWLLGWSLLAAPVFAAISSFIPTMIAVTQDPALTLHER